MMITMAKGDTFMLAMVAKTRTKEPVTGVVTLTPIDLTQWTITAAATTDPDVRPIHKYPLTVEITDAANGHYTLTADTSDWPLGVLDWRIKYVTDSGQVTTTDPMQVSIVGGI